MKVSINLRIRTADGKQPYCPVVWEGKRIKKLKPGWCVVNGVEEFHPEGVYHLSYYVGDKRKQEGVGKHAVLAQRALEQRIASEPEEAPAPAPQQDRATLANCKDKFLAFKRTTAKKDGTPLDKETVDAYEQQVTEFLSVCKHKYPADVDGMDLRLYMAALRERGLSHRTICNNYTSIATFLKFCDVDHKKLLPYNERPTPDDGIPEAYTEDEMRRFFAALTEERHELAFELLLKTGLREREMTTLEWSDFKFGDNPTVTVQARKPHLQFRSKTGKGRTVPLERGLALRLAAWKMKNAGRRLVFGTKSDREDSHFYRHCQEAAERAGLNKKDFWLHKFRDSFGTWTCRAGKVDLRTLQHWMGHTSITMTERYLAPGQGAYAQTGINATFGGMSFGNEKSLATAAVM